MQIGFGKPLFGNERMIAMVVPAQNCLPFAADVRVGVYCAILESWHRAPTSNAVLKKVFLSMSVLAVSQLWGFLVEELIYIRCPLVPYMETWSLLEISAWLNCTQYPTHRMHALPMTNEDLKDMWYFAQIGDSNIDTKIPKCHSPYCRDFKMIPLILVNPQCRGLSI